MKKGLAFVVCLVMCLSLAACQKQSEKVNTDAPSTSATTSTTASTAAPSGTTTTSAPVSGNLSVKDFIASIQPQIDQMASSIESSGMKLSVSARGNSMVYSYQYLTDVGDTSVIKGALDQAMDQMASTFTTILSSMKQVVPDAKSIIVEYLDMNGNVIVSKEYA